MRRALIKLGCPSDRIALQRTLIPTAGYPFRERCHIPGRKISVLFSARFVEKKGLGLLLEAVRSLRRDFPHLRLRVVGDGPLRPEVERFVSATGMGGYTTLLGFLPHADHVRELFRADLFAQPSLTASDGDTEGGAPTAILEAQASGLPIIATAHADIPNIVDRGRSALLSPEGDLGALRRNIARLLRRPELWAGMGRAGRRFVERHHDANGNARNLERHYRSLLEP